MNTKTTNTKNFGTTSCVWQTFMNAFFSVQYSARHFSCKYTIKIKCRHFGLSITDRFDVCCKVITGSFSPLLLCFFLSFSLYLLFSTCPCNNTHILWTHRIRKYFSKCGYFSFDPKPFDILCLFYLNRHLYSFLCLEKLVTIPIHTALKWDRYILLIAFCRYFCCVQ